MQNNISIPALFVGGGFNMTALALEVLIPNLPPWVGWGLLFIGIGLIIFGVFYFFYNRDLKPNVSVLDAINYLSTGKWGTMISGPGRLSTIGKNTTLFNQQVEEGNLTVWGRETEQGGLLNLSNLNWGYVVIDYESIVKGTIEENYELVKTMPREYERTFLMTNKRQARAVRRELKKNS